MPEGVQITLSGSEQADAVYILPFPSPSEFQEAGTDMRETGKIQMERVGGACRKREGRGSSYPKTNR